MTSNQYTIGRSSGKCAATGVDLAPGDRIVTALVERAADEGLERLDFAESAWREDRPPARLVGWWRSTVASPDAPRKAFIDDEALLSLFEQLGETDEPRRVAFRFVLALILIRKRLLRHTGSKSREGVQVMLVRMRGATGWDDAPPPIEVIDPVMDEATIADVTEQLGQALRGES